VKADVDEEQIAPFMQDISRYFEYIDKEEIIKKIVSLEFGKFLAYYADAPEIGKVEKENKKDRKDKRQSDRQKLQNKAQEGYQRLFINLGKRDGFYPGELMQMLNRFVGGRQVVGHIDLLDTISYFEVPERDAKKVMIQLSGIRFKGRQVRCNDAEDTAKHDGRSAKTKTESTRQSKRSSTRRNNTQEVGSQRKRKKDDWKQLMNPNKMRDIEFRGDEPDFSEEGWARRRPKKK
jgi:ATP-dependent RNA helicase DeaD